MDSAPAVKAFSEQMTDEVVTRGFTLLYPFELRPRQSKWRRWDLNADFRSPDCDDTLSHFFGKTPRILRFSVIPFSAWKRASVTHLGRTTRGLCQLFVELRERKVDPVSLKDGFSLDSPAGRLQARIVASVAEFETEVRAERVATGQAAARRKGKKWGGSKQGWRWRATDEQLVSAIHDVRGRGKKIAHIAWVTDLPRPTTIALT